MKKDNIKSIIVLSVICLIVALLLGTVNFVTKDIIKENAEKKVQASLVEALPEASSFIDITETVNDLPDCISKIYKDSDNNGYAVSVITSSQYSSSKMTYTVGINSEGKIVNIVLTNYAETKDFGSEYPNNYSGLSADKIEDVDVFAGVTYSSTAFRNALKTAMDTIAELQEVSE